MSIILFLSENMVPLLIFYIVGFGILAKRPVFDDFLQGAREGIQTVVGILPTLIGLMAAVGVLRNSGFLDALVSAMEIPAEMVQIPVALIPILLVRVISNSAAVGFVLDLFQTYGADSYEGMAASILMGCTETVFYTMSVYFMTVGIRKTRWTLPGALAATAAGVAASLVLAGKMR